DAERLTAFSDDQRRAALAGDALCFARHPFGQAAAVESDVCGDRLDRALSDSPAVEIDAAHPRLGREGNKCGMKLVDIAAAEAVFLLGKDHNAPAFWRFVGQRSKLRGIGQLGDSHTVI